MWSRSHGLWERNTLGGKVENLRDGLRRKAWIVLGDFFRAHALGEAFKDKSYAKPGTPDSRLARQDVVVVYDPLHILSLLNGGKRDYVRLGPYAGQA